MGNVSATDDVVVEPQALNPKVNRDVLYGVGLGVLSGSKNENTYTTVGAQLDITINKWRVAGAFLLPLAKLPMTWGITPSAHGLINFNQDHQGIGGGVILDTIVIDLVTLQAGLSLTGHRFAGDWAGSLDLTAGLNLLLLEYPPIYLVPTYQHSEYLNSPHGAENGFALGIKWSF